MAANVLKHTNAFPVSVDDFLDGLSDVSDCWYNLGEFFLVPEEELQRIKAKHMADPRNCLTAIYKYMSDANNVPSWENIVQAVKQMGNHSLAKTLNDKYMKPPKANYRTDIDEGMSGEF